MAGVQQQQERKYGGRDDPNNRDPTLKLYLDYVTYFDGNLNDLDHGNRYKRPLVGQKLNIIVAKERHTVQMKQNLRIYHAQYSKTQVQDRAKLVARYKYLAGDFFPTKNYVPFDHLLKGFRAPIINDNGPFVLKRGMVCFTILDPITQEHPRMSVHHASSTYISNVYNNLPYYVPVKFAGISQTESIGEAMDVREDCVMADFGTDKILNTSLLSIPVGVYLYMSDFCVMTLDENNEIVPVIDTESGTSPAGISRKAFLPGLFYLTDNSIFSLEKRITEQLINIFRESDVSLGDNASFTDRLKSYSHHIGNICERRSTTYEMRKDFVLYEFATIRAFEMVLDRVDCWEHPGIQQLTEALYHAVSLGARALSFFGRERSEIVTKQMRGFFIGDSAEAVLETDYLCDVDKLKGKLQEYKDVYEKINNNPFGTFTYFCNQRFWLKQRIENAKTMLRAEGIKQLKNKYIGKTVTSSEPGEWFTIEIGA